MAETSIEWTDATWNPVRGCTKISPGCAHCYAETFAERWRGVKGHAYEQGFDLRLVPEKLGEPFQWKAPQRVFVNSMSDLFQDGVPFEFIAEVFGVMAVAGHRFWSGARTKRVGTSTEAGQPPKPIMAYGSIFGPHTFQILTKRAQRIKELLNDRRFQIEVSRSAYRHAFDRVDAGYLSERIRNGRLWPLPNVWLGVSVESQKYADQRIPPLLQTPAAIRFVSYEPALEAVDFEQWIWPGCIDTKEKHDAEHDAGQWCDERSLDWIIVGGESGNNARPFNLQWARDVVAQCQAARVSVFVKQLGAKPFLKFERSHHEERPGFKLSIQQLEVDTTIRLNDSKGGNMEEWPADLRVREFPKVHA